MEKALKSKFSSAVSKHPIPALVFLIFCALLFSAWYLNEDREKQFLEFKDYFRIRKGATREEIEKQFGSPSSRSYPGLGASALVYYNQFQDEAIPQYELIIVFDADGRVSRHFRNRYAYPYLGLIELPLHSEMESWKCRDREVIFSIDKDGRVYLGEALFDLKKAKNIVVKATGKWGMEIPFFIAADKELAFSSLRPVLEGISSTGIYRFKFIVRTNLEKIDDYLCRNFLEFDFFAKDNTFKSSLENAQLMFVELKQNGLELTGKPVNESDLAALLPDDGQSRKELVIVPDSEIKVEQLTKILAELSKRNIHTILSDTSEFSKTAKEK